MALARLALALGLVFVAGCDGGAPAPADPPQAATTGPSASSYVPTTPSIRFDRAPRWMAGYCRKAANDLGFPVLCPGKLPRLVEIIPCRGPAPEEKLWGKHCFDYVLDVLFAGPPGYPGLFHGPGRRTGHLAIWTIGPESDLYPDGLFACPSGSQTGRPDQLGAHEGSWWTCPPGEAANLNTGHVAFQWVENGVVYGLSVHGDASVNEPIVRGVFEQLSLVGPHDAGGSPSAGSANLLSC